jgi:glycosyltransferase involved in cell wall biosynthesis
MKQPSYILITAARNEENYIRTTLESVVRQTCLPMTWLVVSDASTDRTDEIVREFARRYPFIRLLRLEHAGDRNFSSQAYASNKGYSSTRDLDYDFVGFLDADISFEADYHEKLLEQFRLNPRLGLAGGEIHESYRGRFDSRYGNSEESVAGAVQMFRRECMEEIGEFVPLRYGGHDAIAITMARKKGWDVRSFKHLPVYHHRPTGTAGIGINRAKFLQGVQDYALGYTALFEAAKCLSRVAHPPRVTGSLLQFCGYMWGAFTRKKQDLPPDYEQYFRREQTQRLVHSVLGHGHG